MLVAGHCADGHKLCVERASSHSLGLPYPVSATTSQTLTEGLQAAECSVQWTSLGCNDHKLDLLLPEWRP